MSSRILQIVSFLDLFAMGLIVPLIGHHVRILGAEHIYIGLMGTLYSGFQFVSGPLIGCLSDLKGRKAVLILTFLICGIVYTMMGFTNSLLAIMISRVILGLFEHTQILSEALVPDYEHNENNQSEIFAKIAAISGIGLTLGPVIGGHLSEQYPGQAFRLVAVVVGLCYVTNAGLIFILPKKTSGKKQKRTNIPDKTNVLKNVVQNLLNSSRESVSEIRKIDWQEYRVIFFYRGLMEFVSSSHYANYSIFLITMYGLTPRSIGYLISFQGIIRLMSSIFIGYLNRYYTRDKDYSVKNFHLVLVQCLSLLGILCSFNIYMYIFFLIPLGISSAVSKLVALEMLLKKGHSNHTATLIGASNSVRSLSGVIAPILSGIIAQLFGVQYNVCAAFLASALGTFVSYQYKNQKIVNVKKD